MKKWLIVGVAVLGSLAWPRMALGQAGAPQISEKHILYGQRPSAAALLQPQGRLLETNSLRLAISLPLRNTQELSSLLQRLYDPSSPDYRHYLTPQQFTERFGPTAEDYQRVVDFAKSSGLAVSSTHDSRLLLDVSGKVSDIEGAFHVKLRIFQHPKEDRQFYAPDGDPWVDANLPMENVSGLSDYSKLRSAPRKFLGGVHSGSAGGSGLAGTYLGQDFRNAYAPGVTNLGSGQIVGLFEADGYYASDILNYQSAAFSANSEYSPFVPLANVLIDGFNGAPGAGNGEVAVDIEMAIAMAPGLSGIVIFEATNNTANWLDVLDSMASSNSIKQFSSSWGYDGPPDPNTSFDTVFLKMAAQGQSFFQASGDGDAFVTPIWAPADSPYVTTVGGTALTMSGLAAAYSSETVWNSGNLTNAWFGGGNGYWGSGGGVSTVYSIPSWQQGISMVANLGSASMRNIPDLALTAFDIEAVYDDGTNGSYLGTSCSAPLWAGFAALINQQAADFGKPAVGFLNPAIYSIGKGPNYSLCFHDITTGSNTSSVSQNNYFAVPGYDLCTGWGTPTGSNLINALAGVYQPLITGQPASQTNTVGNNASFSVSAAANISATGTTPIYQWQFDGSKIVGASLSSLAITNLFLTNAGSYSVIVTNQWGSLTSSVAVLKVNQGTPAITWANPASIVYGTPLGSVQLNAAANVAGSFAYTPAAGSVLSAGTHSISAVFTPTDSVDYTATTNTVNLVVSAAALTVTASSRSKTYGQTVTFAGTEFTPGGLVNGDTVNSVTLTSSGAAGTASVSGSPFAIAPTAAVGTGLANYTITYVNGSLTVNPAALTVSANNGSKTYGQPVTFAGTEFTPSGLINNDTVSSVTLTSGGAAATALVSGSPFAIVPSAAVGTGLANYSIAYVNGTMSVNPAALTVTANNRSKTYGQTVTFAGTEFSPSGLVNGDTVSSVTLTSPGAAVTAVVSGSPYSIIPGTALGNGLANYTIAYVNGTMTVNPAALTVTANNRSKTYGQTVNFAGTEFTTAGLTNGDNVTSVTLTSAGTAATASVSGSPFAIIPSAALGSGLANYTIAYINGLLTVGQAASIITWANPAAIIYGSALSSVQLDAGANVSGTFSYNLTNGTVLPTGTYTLSVNFTPADAVDYPSASTNVNLVVSPATLTVTAASASRAFDQPNPVFTGVITGLTNGDSIAANYSCSATLTSPVGSYPIVPSLVDPNNLETNYTVNLVNGLLVVGHPSQTFTWTNPAPIIYGTPLTSIQLNASETVAGTFAYTPTNGTVLNTGTNTLSVVFTPTDTVDYTSASGSVSLVVMPAPLTITPASISRTYGQANPVFSGTVAGVTNGDNITATYSCSATAGSPVGGYTITATLVDPNDSETNYTVVLTNGTLTVNPAALTVTANNRSKTYGEAVILVGTGFSPSGLVNGDTVSSVTLTSPGAAGTALVSGSPYNIVPSTAVGSGLANYTITYVNGTLTIIPAALTVTANNRSKTYGQIVTFAGTEFSPNGLLNGDTVSSVTLTSAGAGATASVSGSPFAIIPSAALGSGLANYTIAYINGLLTVGQAASIITWANPAAIIYGSALSSVQLDAGANVSGTFSYNLTNGTVLPTGTYTLSVNFTPADAVDYPSASTNVNLVVSPATLTVTAASASRAFDQPNPVFTGVITGLTNGDSIAANYSCSATLTSPVGSYPIVPSLVDPNNLETNYTVNLVNGLLVVGHPSQTFTWTNPAPIIYGTPLSSIQLDASENVAGTYAYTPTNGTVLDTGTNTLSVVFTPTDTVDYTSASGSVSLVVTQALLTSTPANTSRTYGQANPVFTGRVAGVTNGDNIAATYSCTATAASPVGLYTITPTLVDPNDTETNYTVVLANGTLTITPASLTVTANNQTKTFGQTLTFAGTEFTTIGLLNNDSVTNVTLNSLGAAASATVAGSPYSIVPSVALGSGLTNYTIAYVNGALTVSAGTAVPVIQLVTHIGNSLTLTWSSAATQTYQVQYAASLNQTNWSNLGSSIMATNSTTSASETISGSEGFYRVVLLP